jgi:Family of unknown function (DUF6152)
MRTLLVGLTVVASCLAAPSHAHHSAAMFDAKKEVSVTGTVTEFQYTNPHAWLMVAAADPAGKVTNWSIELGAPAMIERMGIRKSTFPVGEKVTIRFRPMLDGRPAGEFTSAETADGKTVGFRPPPAPPASKPAP